MMHRAIPVVLLAMLYSLTPGPACAQSFSSLSLGLGSLGLGSLGLGSLGLGSLGLGSLGLGSLGLGSPVGPLVWLAIVVVLAVAGAIAYKRHSGRP